MRWLVRGAQGAIALYWLWAAVTALMVTVSLGKPVVGTLSVFGLPIAYSAYGIAGEQYYPPWLLAAMFANRVMFLYAFYRLWRLFGAFARERFFAADTIGHLLAFTGWFTIFTLSRLLMPMVFVASGGQSLPPGVVVQPDLSDLGDLGYPILFFIIAHILNEARKKDEELDRYF